MKYIVIKVKKSYAVVLGEDGKFSNVANFNYKIGDTIEEPFFMKEMINEDVKRNFVSSRIFKLATTVACVMLLSFFSYDAYLSADVLSYVIRINPEIKVVVNRKNEVNRLIALNEDAAKLIEDYDYSNKDKLLVNRELVEKSMQKGYLSEKGKISFKIETTGEEYRVLSKEMRDDILDLLEIEDEDEIEVDTYDDIDESWDVDDDQEEDKDNIIEQEEIEENDGDDD